MTVIRLASEYVANLKREVNQDINNSRSRLTLKETSATKDKRRTRPEHNYKYLLFMFPVDSNLFIIIIMIII